MRWSAAARHAFGECLSALGFEVSVADGIVVAWTKPAGNLWRLMVEVEKERGFHRLHVVLRRRAEAAEEVFTLGDAAGLRGYAYDSPEALVSTLRQAREHFDRWGRPWLDGTTVESPALQAAATHHREFTHGRLVREGRAAYKAKQYPQALALFAEASAIAPLDEASRKMESLAQRYSSAAGRTTMQ